jgi:hypothetical protein
MARFEFYITKELTVEASVVNRPNGMLIDIIECDTATMCLLISSMQSAIDCALEVLDMRANEIQLNTRSNNNGVN